MKLTGASTREYICVGCGKTFSIPYSDARKYTYKKRINTKEEYFCGYTCYSKANKNRVKNI